MIKPSLEFLDAEYHLMVARRRADHYAQHSPDWEIAMVVVHECEQRIRRMDDRATDRPWLGIAAPTH